MPGNFLNSPRATPKGHGAVNDAINLLASFGGGSDDLKNLLKETRDAIGHNERLIADAQIIVVRQKKSSAMKSAWRCARLRWVRSGKSLRNSAKG